MHQHQKEDDDRGTVFIEFENLQEMRSFHLSQAQANLEGSVAARAAAAGISDKPLTKIAFTGAPGTGTVSAGAEEEEGIWYLYQKGLKYMKTMMKGPEISTEQRAIHFDGKCFPPNFMENIVRNQKYTYFSFIPIVMYNQFKFFFNLFFLIITCSQFFEPLKVGFMFTYLAPLLFVLILTMIKEAFDDYKRYLRDKDANSQPCIHVTKTERKNIISSDLQVGQIIELSTNQRIPADLILLWTSDPSGTVFIRTDQLDGETDWKLRKPIAFTQNYAKTKSLYGINAQIVANKPIENIYEFIGVFKMDSQNYKEPLSLENTLWANTVLASGKILAMVAYTGKETRMAMNSREPRSKIGELEMELNYLSKLLFVVMVIISSFIVSLVGFTSWSHSFIQLFRFILLFCSIIPISLRVNLDFAKIVFSYKINNDEEIKGTIARNSTIPEELGRIQFLLTDKTGTLTQNDMIFKKLFLEQVQFTFEDLPAIQKILKKQCAKSKGPMKDIADIIQKQEGEVIVGKKIRRKIKREKEVVVRDLLTALCLCHNVTPIEENGERIYQASSPDEIALVKIAESINMKLVSRDQQKIVIQNTIGEIENYQILANFPFSSETKRMGIILRHTETDRLIFYLKGADTIMKNKVPEYQRGFLLDECENLAREGLRTLVITQKYITEAEYIEWQKQYQEASSVLENREATVRRVVDMLENDMEFLGITGVEDKLQEDVCQTLESVRNAGINVWMLTGDKIETATCIAISAGIKSAQQQLFTMKEMEDPIEIKSKLDEFSNRDGCVLIIDGGTLKCTLEHHKRLFFEATAKAPAVICCRCSPTQKAIVTESIKFYTGRKTCGIGDGGNDVGMIQAADVGIGIVGKEGMQAALAADFSVLQFRALTKLLLWHGRLSYKRSAVMSQFVIHRGLVISVIQAVFSCVFYYVAIPVYNGYLMLGYSTIYTMFPVFCLIFDEDVDWSSAKAYPPLYKTLQKGRELNYKTFLIWVWKSVYQGSMIMLLSLYLFENSFVGIVTITFSVLILTELLNIISETNKLHWVMIASELGTFMAYTLSVIFLKNYIDVYQILSQDFIVKWIFITLVSWLPLHLLKIFLRRYDPTESEKIMKKARTRKVEKSLPKDKQIPLLGDGSLLSFGQKRLGSTAESDFMKNTPDLKL